MAAWYPASMTRTIEEFLPLKAKQLAAVFAEGHPIDPKALENTEYKGISLGLPAFVDKLAWKTFKKTFHRDPDTGHLRGWNVRIQQTGLYGEYKPMVKNGGPFTFGHYLVVDNAGRKAPRPAPKGTLLIDYGVGGNKPFDLMTRFMRDPLVSLQRDNVEMLLGWSYFQVGPFQVNSPSYFLLLRDGPLRHMAYAPTDARGAK